MGFHQNIGILQDNIEKTEIFLVHAAYLGSLFCYILVSNQNHKKLCLQKLARHSFHFNKKINPKTSII